MVPNRMTVVDNLYHQTQEEDPLHITSNFERVLGTEEEPYSRKCKATGEWKPLDCGWLGDNVGMLVIVNTEGKYATTIPSEEERVETDRKIIEVSYNPTSATGWFILPGESMRGYPEAIEKLQIRSLFSTAKYLLYLIPK